MINSSTLLVVTVITLILINIRAIPVEKVVITHSAKVILKCLNIILFIIAPLSDIRMFYIRYLTMHKVNMHAGAIRQLLYGCAHVVR